jgi:hypothetical protein
MRNKQPSPITSLFIFKVKKFKICPLMSPPIISQEVIVVVILAKFVDHKFSITWNFQLINIHNMGCGPTGPWVLF